MNRYSRQSIFHGIGEEGQEKLAAAKIAVAGVGALGTVSANLLCRAGIGFLRLIDRDIVELSNLQRQILFDENDAAQTVPKAVAACRHLEKVNSEITLEPVVAEIDSDNISQLFSGFDLILDGTDNWETRFLINEYCRKENIPWIFCAALGSLGMTMNILPDGNASCLQCLTASSEIPEQNGTCSTDGVLNMTTGFIASMQAAEAVKILLKSPNIRNGLFVADLWNNRFKTMPIEKDADCPVCVKHHYDYLYRMKSLTVKRMCGSDSVQISPERPLKTDLKTVAETLKQFGTVEQDAFMLQFDDGKHKIILFSDGRAVIEHAAGEMNAKQIYTDYFGE
ncbi:thiamine/molybdopterin biosynthesis protein MoeB [Planctomycetales bacterium]|nr:thiamine/molybdopterin biosynthesis protein MoeB [Planctomycetales bacterium]